VKIIFFIFLVVPCALFTEVHASSAWPGESWTESELLTHLDSEFVNNLSGAHWNPVTNTLWVCLNGPGKFWAIVEDGNGSFEIDYENGRLAEWYPGGDLEGITQVDYDEPSIYVIVEGIDRIRKYDVSEHGVVKLWQEWNISFHVPTSGGAGSEGITFVPDFWLEENGFTDEEGNLYTSQNGMGGLIFIAHQNGGRVYVFDLDPDSNYYDFVGKYMTAQRESSGLEFDRSTGILYIWHNTGSNYLELTDLTSFTRSDKQRQFNTYEEYIGPKSGNLEGIAITPISSDDSWIFIADDNNHSGAALMWFKEFFPDIELPTFAEEVRVSDPNDDAEERANGSMYLNSSDLELSQDSSNQTIGIRFDSIDIPSNVTITNAYIQFTVDEAKSEATSLMIFGEDSDNPSIYTSDYQDITSRFRTSSYVSWVPEPWTVVGEASVKQQTPDLTKIVQEIVSNSDWISENAMAFMIIGSGRRTAESYNGMPASAPLLHIEYLDEEYIEPENQIKTLDISVASSNDDAEERANGSMYLNSSDLELVQESSNQTIGVRFDYLNLPPNAIIVDAYIQFTVDEASYGDANLDILGELSTSPQSFSNIENDISLRDMTFASVNWAPEEWAVIGQTGEDQRTPDISSIVQEIIVQEGWIKGSPIAFIITGTGKRVAESFNGSPISAPRLHIEYELN